MPFFCGIQAFLFVLMVLMSAFKLHPIEGDMLTAMQQNQIPIPHGWWWRPRAFPVSTSATIRVRLGRTRRSARAG